MHSFQIRNKSLTYWYLDQAPLHQLQKTDYNLNSEKSTVHFPEKGNFTNLSINKHGYSE